jgi:general secretion pathway protein B
MSVILDALKKLEQEKASSRSGPVDIVPEMVKSREPRVRNGRWLVAVLITGAVAVTAVVTMFAMGSFTASKQQPVPLVSGPTASLPEFLPAPQAVKPVSEPVVRSENNPEPDVIRRNPVRQAEPVMTPTANPPLQRRQSKTVTGERLDETPQETGSSSSALKVSGIAWQDDRSDRRAVVNGMLAAEGEVIEGARIVAIHQDKVRFSRDGRTFDVAITGPTQGK